MKKVFLWFVFLLSAFLTACGGSSNSANNSSDETTQSIINESRPVVAVENPTFNVVELPTYSMLTITSDNAAEVVSMVFHTSKDRQVAMSNAARTLLNLEQPQETFAGLEEFPCDIGKLVQSGQIQQAGTWSSGDQLNISYEDCLLAGVTQDGQQNLTINRFAQTGADFDYAFELDFNNMVIRDGSGLELIMNGDIGVEVSWNDTEGFEYQGSSGLFGHTEGEFSIVTEDLQVSLTSNSPYGDNSRFSSAGTVHDSRLAGAVTFSTPKPFRIISADLPALEGELDIIGADSSRVMMTIKNSQLVTLSVDTDGDGVFEEIRDIAQEDLDPELFNR